MDDTSSLCFASLQKLTQGLEGLSRFMNLTGGVIILGTVFQGQKNGVLHLNFVANLVGGLEVREGIISRECHFEVAQIASKLRVGLSS